MTIPIFYTISDDFTPYLAVSLSSLAENADPEKDYTVIILHQGLSPEHQDALTACGKGKLRVSFRQLDEELLAPIQNRRGNYLRADFFTLSIFYRLFIPELFPEYDKAVYLDADTVVNADIAGLYQTELGSNLVAACHDQSVHYIEPLQTYIRDCLGLDPAGYVNSGVLLMNCRAMREEGFVDKFLRLLTTYQFNSIAPDQDYLNEICAGRIKLLDPRWDAMPNDFDPEMADPALVHYNLFYKPWHFAGVKYESYFWQAAKETPFYQELKQELADFSEQDRQAELAKMQGMVDLVGQISQDPQNWFHVKQEVKVTL
ncbi:glucosyltransferase [Lactobacillus nasalidis]|uniref:Glucosyltransferase n=1 Tax=Lactobacillus nasalidis TaxID=2797258 RepID=A0ABQ3W8J0_9LACO|nr:glycosyltransferase family 8 protein [Lactobacillus nasalidis]GHV98374.1 glucosyltransferase [Lactobacillus nasalidis]GHV99532.1 glucosyltransferase [Lactobacillus nasalidis]GHW00502.1 glucosyltransferase [Lactobacillus nasalidis]